MKNTIYDVAGIGIGPFNLSLAALTDEHKNLNCIFFDKKFEFQWHEGMLLEDATVQVPFYADLVTLANPCSKFSFLSFLKHKGRLFHFAIRENNYVTRLEYNLYCKWIIQHLQNLHFSHEVQMIYYNEKEKYYCITVKDIFNNRLKTVSTYHLVIGVGTAPHIPIQSIPSGVDVIHSADYLSNRKQLLKKKSATVIGSGQSAAEIFYNLLQHHDKFTGGLFWFTQSKGFLPMDLSKLSLELTSPDYIDHFYKLPSYLKAKVLASQDMLYKGINSSLIDDIYNYLYIHSIYSPLKVSLYPNCRLKEIRRSSENKIVLLFEHLIEGKQFEHITGSVVMATGYKYIMPSFIKGISKRIGWDEKGRYATNKNYSIDINGKEIFVQNAELHTHGFTAPDLGMAPYRSAIILNEILGYEHYKLDKKIAFQKFRIEEGEGIHRISLKEEQFAMQ